MGNAARAGHGGRFGIGWVTAAILVPALVLLAVLVRWQYGGGKPVPRLPNAGEVGLDLRVVPDGNVDKVAARFGVPAGGLSAPLPGFARGPIVVGQLRWVARPDLAGETLFVIVIDKRSHRVSSQAWAAEPAGQGWDGILGSLTDRYPWLHDIHDIQVVDGIRYDYRQAIMAAPDRPGPVTFDAVFPGGTRITDPAADLLVAVAVGNSERMLWAVRVSG